METIPGLPKFRVRANIAFQLASGDMALWPSTVLDNVSRIRIAVTVSA